MSCNVSYRKDQDIEKKLDKLSSIYRTVIQLSKNKNQRETQFFFYKKSLFPTNWFLLNILPCINWFHQLIRYITEMQILSWVTHIGDFFVNKLSSVNTRNILNLFCVLCIGEGSPLEPLLGILWRRDQSHIKYEWLAGGQDWASYNTTKEHLEAALERLLHAAQVAVYQ